MKKQKKIMVWTHWDLDGAVSYLVIKWAFPDYIIDYASTSVEKFREHYIQWLSTHNEEDYEILFSTKNIKDDS